MVMVNDAALVIKSVIPLMTCTPGCREGGVATVMIKVE